MPRKSVRTPRIHDASEGMRKVPVKRNPEFAYIGYLQNLQPGGCHEEPIPRERYVAQVKRTNAAIDRIIARGKAKAKRQRTATQKRGRK